MNNYVLFSPLGMTDPSRGLRDGAFIHICRFYKPRKVYIYMSAEICKLDALDNRYEIYLDKLCNKLGFTCEAHKIKRKDLIDVHNFEMFYDDFQKLIDGILEDNPDSTILLNLSSGTPQMKAALNIVCSLHSQKLIPIQVSTPVKKSNVDKPVGDVYDIEIEWSLNEDNTDSNPSNRCTVIKNENFQAVIKKEIIKRHINEFDYRAALDVAETIVTFLDPRIISLLKAAKHRLLQDIGAADTFARSACYSLIPSQYSKILSENRLRSIFEYLLAMQIKLYNGEIGDFIRSISPVLTSLCELYLDMQCEIDVRQYYSLSGRRPVLKLSRRYLPEGLLQILDNEFGEYKDSPPSAMNLLPLVLDKGRENVACIAKELRNVEENARNIAAHEIVSVDEQWVNNKTGHNAEDILKMLKQFLSSCKSLPNHAWNSYGELNQAVLKLL